MKLSSPKPTARDEREHTITIKNVPFSLIVFICVLKVLFWLCSMTMRSQSRSYVKVLFDSTVGDNDNDTNDDDENNFFSFFSLLLFFSRLVWYDEICRCFFASFALVFSSSPSHRAFSQMCFFVCSPHLETFEYFNDRIKVNSHVLGSTTDNLCKNTMSVRLRQFKYPTIFIYALAPERKTKKKRFIFFSFCSSATCNFAQNVRSSWNVKCSFALAIRRSTTKWKWTDVKQMKLKEKQMNRSFWNWIMRAYEMFIQFRHYFS